MVDGTVRAPHVYYIVDCRRCRDDIFRYILKLVISLVHLRIPFSYTQNKKSKLPYCLLPPWVLQDLFNLVSILTFLFQQHHFVRLLLMQKQVRQPITN